MKSMIKIFSVALLLVFAMASCSKSEYADAKRTPSPEVEGAGVYFGNQITVVNVDDSKIVVPVYRTDSDGSLTVPVSFSAKDGALFTFPSSVAFSDGQSKVELVIPVDEEAMEYNVNYPFTATITDESMTTPYGMYAANLNALRPLTWKVWARGDYTEPIGGESFVRTISKADQGNIFRIDSPYGEYSEVTDKAVHFSFTWDIDNKATSIEIFGGEELKVGAVTTYAQYTGFPSDPFGVAGGAIWWATDIDPEVTFYDPATETLTIKSYYALYMDGAWDGRGLGWMDDVFVITEFLAGDPWE